MSGKSRTYSDVLKEAQAKGFAEANPLLDVNGTDTAHKLAILARLAFQRRIDFSKIGLRASPTCRPKIFLR